MPRRIQPGAETLGAAGAVSFLFTADSLPDNPTDFVASPRKVRPLPKIMSVNNTSRHRDCAALEAREPDQAPDSAALELHGLMETLFATGLCVSEPETRPKLITVHDDRLFSLWGKGA